ncbi:MAG: GNAT family N-acetyltransferase [Parabacteroides sp.]
MIRKSLYAFISTGYTKEENTLVIEKDGQVVSALQMLPYTMTYYGTEISVAYISGACTLPSMRGKRPDETTDAKGFR